jgi:hypothetical protein
MVKSVAKKVLVVVAVLAVAIPFFAEDKFFDSNGVPKGASSIQCAE